MKQQLDLGYLNEVLDDFYDSKAEMAKRLGITRSHLQEVFKNKGVGEKVLKGLKGEAEKRGFEFELCLKAEPIFMHGLAVESIEITDKDGGLIASITSRNVITYDSTKVIVVPSKN